MLRYVGITTSEGRRHGEVERIMRAQPLDFVQVTYNILTARSKIASRCLCHPLRSMRAKKDRSRWDVRDIARAFEAITLPMTLIGILIGERVQAGLSELTFRRLVNVTLIVSGFALLLAQ